MLLLPCFENNSTIHRGIGKTTKRIRYDARNRNRLDLRTAGPEKKLIALWLSPHIVIAKPPKLLDSGREEIRETWT